MKGRVQAYVVVVTLCALTAAAGIGMLGDPTPLTSSQAAVCFAFLGVFAQLLRYKPDADTAATIVFIPFLATLFLAPTWVAIIAIAVVALIGAVIRGQSRLKATFNISQYVVIASAAIAVYRSLGGLPLLSRPEFNWPAYVAAFSVFVLLNGLLVCVAVAMSEAKPLLATWLAHARTAITYDVLSLPLAYLFAVVYVHFGAVGAMALGLPLLAARQLYKTNWQLETVNQELLELMVAAIEARDPYTSGHSRRVARNARIIARALGLSSREVERVGVAALLHDVGKIHEVFAPILRKPGKLTPDERLAMETHPLKSAELVQNVSHLSDQVIVIRNHHENWDGTGYPDGLRADEIPLGSRIIMIADTIDAMTTDRPYRAAMTEAEVRAELIRFRGIQFDPEMCDVLLRSPLYVSLFERPGTRTPVRLQSWPRRSVSPRIAAGA
jgi:HD-GYP domain-containing protein (c-di-GMP phosphodiesterase class II)